MKEWIMFMILFFGLIDLEAKMNKISKQQKQEMKKNNFNVKKYLNIPVSIYINNDEISNSYLFSSISPVEGMIKDFDLEWILFEYQEKKKTISQYIRICDITSINEVKKLESKKK